jgi:glycosyltransferase involved in cell wall biosynthesis
MFWRHQDELPKKRNGAMNLERPDFHCSDRKKVLVIAYHFPPQTGSSGILRTLKFVRYLPELGYEPIVLTVNPRAYQKTDGYLLSQIPEATIVQRAFAIDTRRHLAFRGSYFQFMALPDPIAAWIPAGILTGINLIRRHKIDIVFSTYPISGAHVIGRIVSRMTRRPWVADFRDHMWDETSQLSSSELKLRQMIESATARCANHIVVTTDGMRRLFLDRYQELADDRVSVIENGFDEYDFENITISKQANKPCRLIHAGLLEPSFRDPIPFFHAVKLSENKINQDDVVVDLLAPGNEEKYQQEIVRLGLSNLIRILPAVPYHEGLKKMAEADVLLLFQGPGYNELIPAKLYEYFRIGRPILAFAPEDSDTARLIRCLHAGEIVPIDRSQAIANVLAEWIRNIRQGFSLPAIRPEKIAKFSRKSQAAALAKKFEKALQKGDPPRSR